MHTWGFKRWDWGKGVHEEEDSGKEVEGRERLASWVSLLMPEKVLLFLSLWFLDFFLVIEKKSLHILYFFLHSFSFLLSVLFPFSPFAALVDLLWHGLLSLSSLLLQSFSLKISRCDLFSLPMSFSFFHSLRLFLCTSRRNFLLVYPASSAQTFSFSYSNTSSFLLFKMGVMRYKL